MNDRLKLLLLVAVFSLVALPRGAVVAAPPDYIVESRTGGSNSGQYSETGVLSDSVAKSTAAGCASGIGSRYGSTYSSVVGEKHGIFKGTIAVAGYYEVFTTWGNGNNRRSPIRHTVSHADGTANVDIDQAAEVNIWKSLGTYRHAQGADQGTVDISNVAINTSGSFYCDAVKWVWHHPNTPSGLTATAVSATQINLSWSGVDLPSGGYYKIERKTGSGGSWSQIATNVTATTYNNSGLLSSTQYYYRVRAYETNDSDYSNEANATTSAGPVTIFEDGFDGNLNNWTQGTAPYGAFEYSTLVNHGLYPGAGGAYMELVPYDGTNANYDRMFRKFFRLAGQNGEAGPHTGEAYPTPFAEGIVSGYFHDFKDAHKMYQGGRSCSQLRQALSLRGMNSNFVLDNGIYYGNPVSNDNIEFPGEEHGSTRAYSMRAWGPGGAAGVAADRGMDWQRWGALRWDHNPTYTYPNWDCTGTIGWVWFQTEIVPDAPSAHSSQVDSQARFNLWRKDELHDTSAQTKLNQNVPYSYWKFGFDTILLGAGKSEESAGMWDDISFKANRPGDPVIAPAQAGPLPGNDPKTSITWHWTNANVGNNIFAYDLADPDGVNVAPVFPQNAEGGVLDGKTGQWIQRWQTQWTEKELTPNAPYRRKVHAWNGTLNSNYTNVSFQTRLLDGTIVGNNTGAFPDVSTYTWAQAGVDPDGSSANGNLHFWAGYMHPEEHLAIDGVAVAPNTAHGHGPSSTWWHKHVSGHNPFAFENSAMFGTSTHGGSAWKASRFKYVWNRSATPPAWNSSTPATEWSSGTINLACTDTFLPGGTPVDGAYYLHVAAMNENGEWNYTAADTATYGPFQYDHTPPNNPAVACDDGFGEGEVHADPSPSFTLSGASDPGTAGVNASGLEVTPEQRYRYYWGPESNPAVGVPNTLTDETITGLTVPLNSTGTYYLHVQTKDEAGNWSEPVTCTYHFKTPEWEFPTGAVNLAPPGVYNWDDWYDPNGKHDSMVFASSNSKAHGVWGTSSIIPTPGPKLKDAVQAEDIWLEATPTGALALNGQVYGRLPVARLNVGSPESIPARTVIGGTCAPDPNQPGRVYAIEAGTRQVLWTHDIGMGYNVKAKPGGAFNKTINDYTGDVIYAVTDKQSANNYLRALKATDGTQLWSTEQTTPALTGVGPILGAPFLMPVGNQEAVYFATMDDGAQPGGVYAINLANGSLLNASWPKQLGSFKSALGTDGSFVYGVNEAGELWKISLNGSSATNIATLDVGADQGIYGAPCWVYPRWVSGANWLIISSNAGKVYCIDVANPGAPKWVVDIPAPSCPVYWNGSVYVGSSNRRLYQLDVDDGSTVTTRNLPATVGDPVIDQVWNRLYLHAGDGVMYGFNLPL